MLLHCAGAFEALGWNVVGVVLVPLENGNWCQVLPQQVVAAGAAWGGATVTRREEGATKDRRGSWKSNARTERATAAFNNTKNPKDAMKETGRNIATQ